MAAPVAVGHPTEARIHLDRLARNLRVLRELARGRPLWPAVKANAYGHGAVLVARELVALGCDRLCVAHVAEALELLAAGVAARILLLSPAPPEHAEAIVAHDLEPVVCTAELREALARAAARAGRRVAIHVKVDSGMGRVGVRPEELAAFLEGCDAHPELVVRGLMSHFPRADEKDAAFSRAQIEHFARLREQTRSRGIAFYHFANSAAILELPESLFDAARPGIALYGLAPSAEITNPRVRELEPVLEWRTRVSFLKEVPAGSGLSYGHSFRTERPSLIATLAVGYGDGLARSLSNRLQVLVGGVRCPQVGRITMDQSLVDVTALRGRVALGDEAVLIGRQGDAAIGADELAALLGTVAYEIVTAISARVPRVVSSRGQEASEGAEEQRRWPRS